MLARRMRKGTLMRMIRMKGTDLSVTPLCLGTVNYGTGMEEAAAKEQLTLYARAGGNFLDTAHVYGDWVPGVRGRSERVIGSWLRESGLRGQMVIATKGAHPRLDSMHSPRLRPEDMEEDLKESLDCLGIDCIDLYLLHRDDPSVPAGEIIDWLAQKASEGSIRYYGCSNWRLARIIEANRYAGKEEKPGFACNQLMWSLAIPNHTGLSDSSMMMMDAPTYAYHLQSGMSVMGYMSVAKGYFMRRAAGEGLPDFVEKMYASAPNDKILEELKRLSEATGYSIMDLCILYFAAHPFAAVPIASFSTNQQLKEGLHAAGIMAEGALIERLHEIRPIGD